MKKLLAIAAFMTMLSGTAFAQATPGGPLLGGITPSNSNGLNPGLNTDPQKVQKILDGPNHTHYVFVTSLPTEGGAGFEGVYVPVVQKNVVKNVTVKNYGSVTVTAFQKGKNTDMTQSATGIGANIGVDQQNWAGVTEPTPGTPGTITEFETRVYVGNAHGHDPFDTHNGQTPYALGDPLFVETPGTSGAPGSYVVKQVNKTTGVKALNYGSVFVSATQKGVGGNWTQSLTGIGANLSISQKNVGYGGPTQVNNVD